MGKVVAIPLRKRLQIQALLVKEKLSGREIARKVGVSESVVSRMKHKLLKGESLSPKYKNVGKKNSDDDIEEETVSEKRNSGSNKRFSNLRIKPTNSFSENAKDVCRRQNSEHFLTNHDSEGEEYGSEMSREDFDAENVHEGNCHSIKQATRIINKSNNSDILDIDIKTEAVDYDEDFDREWNEDFTEANSQSPILTHALTRDRIPNGGSDQLMNGYNNIEEELSSHSNASDIVSARVKLEPRDSLEDDYDPVKVRFNLRKRKASLGLESMTDPEKDGDGEGSHEEDLNGKKRKKKIQYTYTNNMLQEALDLVHSQNISIMNAAKQYGIPRSTLRRYALTMWAAAAPKSKNKQEPALTPPEEAHLVSMITKMSRAGKYVSTMDVKSTVQHLLDESQRIVFKDRNRPNAGWVQRFRKRHRDLQIKGSGYTAKRQTPLTRQDVSEWYNEVTRYLSSDWEINLTEFFTDENRHRVFNLDEMMLPLNYKSDLIEENISKREEDYMEITILSAVSAAGECLQPLIIQKGEGGGHEDDIMPLDQNSYGISFSLSGKMNSDIFMRWLEAFDRELCEKGVQKPIIIYLDDIFAHFHISVFSYAIDNDIILLCVQAQNGTIMQPVEAEITDMVRTTYRMFAKGHYKLEMAPVSMDLFPLTFLRAWEAVRAKEDLKDKLQKAFASMGLFPLNPDAPVFADFPLCPEIIPKDFVKAEKLSKNKEPKAKKTIAKNSLSKEPSQSGCGLIPKVKIKKLDKDVASDHYKIIDFAGFSSPVKMNDSLEKNSLKSETDSFAEPESKWHPSPKSKKVPTTYNGMPPSTLSQFSLERLEGRQDGIKKCIDLMESLIPNDLIPVWRNRSEDLKNSCEIPYCMWRTVHNMFNELTLQVERQNKALARGSHIYNNKSRPPSSKQFPKKRSRMDGTQFDSDSFYL